MKVAGGHIHGESPAEMTALKLYPNFHPIDFLKKLIEIQKSTEVCYFSGTGDVRKKVVTDGRLDMFMGDMWKPSIRERLVAKQEFNNSLDNMHASVEIIVSCK